MIFQSIFAHCIELLCPLINYVYKKSQLIQCVSLLLTLLPHSQHFWHQLCEIVFPNKPLSVTLAGCPTIPTEFWHYLPGDNIQVPQSGSVLWDGSPFQMPTTSSRSLDYHNFYPLWLQTWVPMIFSHLNLIIC